MHKQETRNKKQETREFELNLKALFTAYLSAYARKDLDAVSAMFSDNISLRDWKISVQGKKLAVAETKSNFQSAETIEIVINNIYESSNAVAGELVITVDRTEILYVVDVVTFDGDGKIESIRAYLGRGD